LIPFLPPFAILCAYTYEKLISQDRLLRNILNIFIGFTISSVLLLHIGKTAVRLPVVFGFETRDEYLRKMVNIYSTVEYVNNNLEDSSKVLLVGDRGYYFDKPFIIGPAYHGYIGYRSFRRPEDFLNRLKELGITHMLIDRPREFVISEFLDLIGSNEDFLTPKNFILIYKGNSTPLYEVHY